MRPELRAALSRSLGVEVASAASLGGGDTAAAYRVVLDDGRTVFAKTVDDPRPDVFTTEAASLAWLGEARAVRVPEVLAVGRSPAVLVLEWIEGGASGPQTEASFGRALARLHRAGSAGFGRQDRRTTGSRALPNDPAPTWSDFLRDRRLLPLADLADGCDALDPTTTDLLRRVAGRLEILVGEPEPAARLHGDLWGGNRVVDADGESWLIDPAAFGGHREFDLAMMRLFGGFGPAVFDAYAESHPLGDGWADRVALHQISPLVVHAIKFGGGYVRAATDAIGRYA